MKLKKSLSYIIIIYIFFLLTSCSNAINIVSTVYGVYDKIQDNLNYSSSTDIFGKPSSGLSFALNKEAKTYKVIGMGDCLDNEVIIPSRYNGLPVTEISTNAFKKNMRLFEIYIPETIEKIGDYVFQNCYTLQKAVLTNVNELGHNVFENCKQLHTVEFSNNLKNIPSYTFHNCEKLVNININEGIEILGYQAFSNCKSLKSITLSNELDTIESLCFYKCENLLKIVFPTSVRRVKDSAFEGCTMLSEVTILSTKLYQLEEKLFSDCKNLTSINIPNNITRILANCFFNCESLVSVSLPEGLTEIFSNAFTNCTKLESLHIPASVKLIYSSTGLTSLKTITIDENNEKYYVLDNVLYKKTTNEVIISSSK